MKSIFLNDFYNLKNNAKSMFLVIITLSIYPVTRIMQNSFNYLMLLFVMFTLSFLVNSYILNTCFYDDSAGFTKYLKAMPIKIKDYVGAKFYVMGAVNFVIILLFTLGTYIKSQSVEITVFLCFALSFLLAVSLVNLTFTMKMGYDKFSIYITSIFIIGYLALFFMSQRLGNEVLYNIISSVNILYLAVIITADVVLTFVLKNVAVKFFEERVK